MIVVLATAGPAHAQSVLRYRGYEMGGSLASIAALAGVTVSSAKTIHERPAVTQDLEWRSKFSYGDSAAAADPVAQMIFSFYNDQLFRLMIKYDPDRTKGLTDADLIEAMSALYGPPSHPSPKGRGASLQADADSDTRVAGWGDSMGSAVLYRSSYRSDFRLVVTLPHLEALARTADLQAIALDERDRASARGRQAETGRRGRAGRAGKGPCGQQGGVPAMSER